MKQLVIAEKPSVAKDLAKAEELLNAAFRLIDKSVSDGVQHKNTAGRQKAELSRLVNSIR